MRKQGMTIKSVGNWFGSNRILAHTVGEQLGKLKWCGVVFVGGASELPHIQCSSGIANDRHRHLINLARVISDPVKKAELIEMLDCRLFHPDELHTAQQHCLEREEPDGLFVPNRPRMIDDMSGDVQWAVDYFICCWMGRGGQAGTDSEFRQSISVRWSTTGGDSAKRFRSAIESIDPWHRVMRDWQFTCLDCFAFLNNVVDEISQGLYVDAPWPGPGDAYAHKFPEPAQRRLAKRLLEFPKTRIVIRYGDHPLIRELYADKCWTWIEQGSRDQANGEVPEVLIVKGPKA